LRKQIYIYIFTLHFSIIAIVSNLYRLFLATQIELLTFIDYLKSFFVGIVFDFTVAVYTFIPLALALLFFRERSKNKAAFRRTLISLLGYELFIVLFTTVSEFMFYQEFNDRFNFIAVDYLVYTNEVLRNIWESYHLISITILILIIACIVTFYFYKNNLKHQQLSPLSAKEKALFVSAYAVVFALTLQTVNQTRLISMLPFSDSILLSKNGFHSLFAAYRNNEISYDQYYPAIDQARANHLVYEALKSEEDKADLKNSPSAKEEPNSIIRNIVASSPPTKKNVILILMESLSARYLGTYGNTLSLTPNLDSLTTKGLFFDHAYSTGIRTVRGLEAIALSIPPTPGQSIVRRPAGTGLYNIGTVFKQYGYENKFLYGGNAIFDNMEEFFSGNGFQVIDSRNFKSDEVQFENAWGICDEDLLTKAISEADLSYAKKTPFFSFVLTASNHRPYTYPENKIDIPSGTNRDGAIKYADFSIGEFLKAAEKKPWFKDTVFIFVSDHNASVAGAIHIQIEDYHIPFIFYSPGFIQPKTVSHLVSQIDLAPTLFSLLNFSYQSRFFGVDATANFTPRAFMATYKKIAYYDSEELVVLLPTKLIEESSGTLKKYEVVTSDDKPSIQAAVSFYKTASDLFRTGSLREDKKYPTDINTRH
jgi:phosphoglycerol transferase MdoB-like AlkP superfamily enzyme